MDDDRLSLNDLRDAFGVTDAAWIVYQRRDGSISGTDVTRTSRKGTNLGMNRVAQVVEAGGVVLARVSGVSLHEAIRAVKQKQASRKAA